MRSDQVKPVIDFNQCDTPALIQAFEQVDDFQYPDHALNIYTLISERLNLDFKDIDAHALGYDCAPWQKLILSVMTSFSWTSLMFGWIEHKNEEMAEKIDRLQERIEQAKSNKKTDEPTPNQSGQHHHRQ